jgi:hypothetical protein
MNAPVDQVVHFSQASPPVAPAARATYTAPAAQSTYIAPAGTGANESAIHAMGVGINIHTSA